MPPVNVPNGDHPVNIQFIEETADGDMAFARELLEVFLSDCRERLERLGQGVCRADAELVRRESHTIKGASGNLGATGLRALAFDLEHVNIAAEPEKAERLMSALWEEYSRVERFIQAYLGNLDGGNL